MAEDHIRAVEWIIANTINEAARGDPDTLAAHIVAAVREAGYRIIPVKMIPLWPQAGVEDTASGFSALLRDDA